MAETAAAAGRIDHLARARLHVGDKILERLGLELGIGDQAERIAGHIADRGEVVDGVVAGLPHCRQDGDLRQRGHHQVVAIGLRTRDGLGCNDAASADAIFDDERLAQLLGEILTDQPRNPVRVAPAANGTAILTGRCGHLSAACAWRRRGQRAGGQ